MTMSTVWGTSFACRRRIRPLVHVTIPGLTNGALMTQQFACDLPNDGQEYPVFLHSSGTNIHCGTTTGIAVTLVNADWGGLKEVTAKGKASMEINWICGLIKEVLRTCHSGGYGRETSYWTMFDGPLNWRDTRCIFALTSQTGRTFRCGFRSLHKHIHK